MALKFQLDSLDGLDEGVAALYTQGDDGKYTLGVEGLPEPKHDDVSGLKRKLDELLGEKKESERKRKEAEEAARKAAEDAARKSGDTSALDKSWSEKYAAIQADKDAEIKRLNDSLTGVLVDSVASQLASDLAIQGSANVLLPHIRARLAVDYTDGKPVTRVLDAAGKPSAATIDELKAEFAATPAFAPIVAGTKASGGGASGAGRGGAATKRFAELTEAERVKLYREGPEKYAQYKADHP